MAGRGEIGLAHMGPLIAVDCSSIPPRQCAYIRESEEEAQIVSEPAGRSLGNKRETERTLGLIGHSGEGWITVAEL